MGLRIIATVFLLVNVWMHAHWSVAACLTLMFAGEELRAYMLKKEGVVK